MSTDIDEGSKVDSSLEKDPIPTTRNDPSSSREPTKYDVLCGRGRDCYEHLGNKIFRTMIDANLKLYMETETKHERGTIVSGIVDRIRKTSSSFLRFDTERQTWIELPEYEARKWQRVRYYKFKSIY